MHQNKRFSEDLDFDNFGITEQEFRAISELVKSGLEQQGYTVEIQNVFKGAFHCNIRLPRILHEYALGNHIEEKILIQIDTEAHNYRYKPDTLFLNKFEIFSQVNSTPLSILLAQKYYDVLNRKGNKGRDFYDIIFLLGKEVKPDFSYLKIKTKIENIKQLKQAIISKCETISMEEMAKDVEPFLFNSNDTKKVKMFVKYFDSIIN